MMNGDPDIPAHVQRELDAEADAYQDAGDRYASQVWRSQTLRERIGRRLREIRHRSSIADTKAAAATRAEAVADADDRKDYPAYFQALAEVRRHDGIDAVQDLVQELHRHAMHEIKVRQFERQSRWWPAHTADVYRLVFTDDDTDGY